MIMVIDVISDRRQHRCACSQPGYCQQCSANHERVTTALTPATVHVYGRTERKHNFHCIGTPQSLLLISSLHQLRSGHCAHPLLPHQDVLAQLFSRLAPTGLGSATPSCRIRTPWHSFQPSRTHRFRIGYCAISYRSRTTQSLFLVSSLPPCGRGVEGEGV